MAPFSSPPPTSNASQPIELSFDILDYIFAFLRYDTGSLLACSEAHPAFSQIVERHLYYHINITSSPNFETIGPGYPLEPPQLIKLLSETPKIINHVRVLQVAFCENFPDMVDEYDPSHEGYAVYEESPDEEEDRKLRSYEEIAMVLPGLCALETIFLTGRYYIRPWQKLPQTLKTAVEGCLRLPTLHNAYLGMHIPLSILDNNPNIDCLSLSGPPQIPDCPDETDTSLQLKSLTVGSINAPYLLFWIWAKRHIIMLGSLQCTYAYSSEKDILEALEICSGTLNDLDLSIKSPYETTCDLRVEGKPALYFPTPPIPLINISSLHLLQHLTLRVVVYYDDDSEYTDFDTIMEFYVSPLPSAVEMLKTASSVQCITIEILVEHDVDTRRVWRSIDFSSLAALAESTSFHHIDLYCLNISHARILSKLLRYESLKKWIEQGVLVIHAEQSAPGNPQYALIKDLMCEDFETTF